jgi:hypothetical protein
MGIPLPARRKQKKKKGTAYEASLARNTAVKYESEKSEDGVQSFTGHNSESPCGSVRKKKELHHPLGLDV